MEGEIRRAHRTVALRLMQFPIPHPAESEREEEKRRGIAERRAGGKGGGTGS